MDVDYALARYLAYPDVARWLFNDEPVKTLTVRHLRECFVYSIGIGTTKNKLPKAIHIEEMLISVCRSGSFVLGILHGFGQPHLLSQTPMMKGMVPVSRRFAVDLSAKDALEFMEFDIFADGTTIVAFRRFLHTKDSSLPCLVKVSLHSKTALRHTLGKIKMKAQMVEAACCPQCRQVANSCYCNFQSNNEAPYALTNRTNNDWNQFTSNFQQKAEFGMVRFSISAVHPQMGDVPVINQTLPVMNVLQRGNSDYLNLLRRRAVHNMGIDLTTPRTDALLSDDRQSNALTNAPPKLSHNDPTCTADNSEIPTIDAVQSAQQHQQQRQLHQQLLLQQQQLQLQQQVQMQHQLQLQQQLQQQLQPQALGQAQTELLGVPSTLDHAPPTTVAPNPSMPFIRSQTTHVHTQQQQTSRQRQQHGLEQRKQQEQNFQPDVQPQQRPASTANATSPAAATSETPANHPPPLTFMPTESFVPDPNTRTSLESSPPTTTSQSDSVFSVDDMVPMFTARHVPETSLGNALTSAAHESKGRLETEKIPAWSDDNDTTPSGHSDTFALDPDSTPPFDANAVCLPSPSYRPDPVTPRTAITQAKILKEIETMISNDEKQQGEANGDERSTKQDLAQQNGTCSTKMENEFQFIDNIQQQLAQPQPEHNNSSNEAAVGQANHSNSTHAAYQMAIAMEGGSGHGLVDNGQNGHYHMAADMNTLTNMHANGHGHTPPSSQSSLNKYSPGTSTVPHSPADINLPAASTTNASCPSYLVPQALPQQHQQFQAKKIPPPLDMSSPSSALTESALATATAMALTNSRNQQRKKKVGRRRRDLSSATASGAWPATSSDENESDSDRKHACKQCSSRFKMRGDLLRHVKIVHEGKRMYTCQFCSKKFGHSGHLNRHVQSVHLHQRRFKCNFCGFQFYQASHLQSHVNHIHSQVRKTFPCKDCHMTFKSQVAFRNHHAKCVVKQATENGTFGDVTQLMPTTPHLPLAHHAQAEVQAQLQGQLQTQQQ